MDANLATVLVALIAAVASTFAALISHWNGKKINEVHQQINSRLDAWIEAQAAIAKALGVKEGIVQGIAEEKARTKGDPHEYEP